MGKRDSVAFIWCAGRGCPSSFVLVRSSPTDRLLHKDKIFSRVDIAKSSCRFLEQRAVAGGRLGEPTTSNPNPICKRVRCLTFLLFYSMHVHFSLQSITFGCQVHPFNQFFVFRVPFADRSRATPKSFANESPSTPIFPIVLSHHRTQISTLETHSLFALRSFFTASKHDSLCLLHADF